MKQGYRVRRRITLAPLLLGILFVRAFRVSGIRCLRLRADLLGRLTRSRIAARRVLLARLVARAELLEAAWRTGIVAAARGSRVGRIVMGSRAGNGGEETGRRGSHAKGKWTRRLAPGEAAGACWK